MQTQGSINLTFELEVAQAEIANLKSRQQELQQIVSDIRQANALDADKITTLELNVQRYAITVLWCILVL